MPISGIKMASHSVRNVRDGLMRMPTFLSRITNDRLLYPNVISSTNMACTSRPSSRFYSFSNGLRQTQYGQFASHRIIQSNGVIPWSTIQQRRQISQLTRKKPSARGSVKEIKSKKVRVRTTKSISSSGSNTKSVKSHRLRTSFIPKGLESNFVWKNSKYYKRAINGITTKPTNEFQEDKLGLAKIRLDADAIECSVKQDTHNLCTQTIRFSRPITRSFSYPPSSQNKDSDDRSDPSSVHQLLSSLSKSHTGYLPTISIEGLNSILLQQYSSQKMGVAPKNSTDPYQIQRSQVIAQQLQLPYYNTRFSARNCSYLLIVGSKQFFLQECHSSRNSPLVHASFLQHSLTHRIIPAIQAKTPLMRAIHLRNKPNDQTRVLDATGGLGVDAFLMAYAGYHVTVLERHPLVYTLLFDAWNTAKQLPEMSDVMNRMRLVHADSTQYLPNLDTDKKPDVTFLDPMYPLRQKMTALPKKGILLTRSLIGGDDADILVQIARQNTLSKIVLKRPYYVTESPNVTTSYKSRSVRFEVFNPL